MARGQTRRSLWGPTWKTLYVDKVLTGPARLSHITDVRLPWEFYFIQRMSFPRLFIPWLILISLETLFFQTVTVIHPWAHLSTSPFHEQGILTANELGLVPLLLSAQKTQEKAALMNKKRPVISRSTPPPSPDSDVTGAPTQ